MEALADSRRAMTEVYSYLLRRCGSKALAEDLTSESLLGAVDRYLAGDVDHLSVAYCVGIARHKLVDHWRRQTREERLLRSVEGAAREVDGHSWDVELDGWHARDVLSRLTPFHRAALTLRYLDGLSVPEAAAVLDRTVAATEALLVRARREFRHVYEGSSDA
jgi:RNA polymerase sigma-70 factor (ECF subfamily)